MNVQSIPTATGTCVVIGGGYGTGAVIPTAMDLKKAGNKVIGIVGARSQENVIMLDELSKVCDEVQATTNDGSMGMQGLVTDALAKILEQEKVIHVLAVGPVPMMKAVSELTRDKNIPTFVSLNAIMVDGTGMCGACRVTVGGETKFACFHGPDFDGHKVDFENLMKRQKMFAKEERLAVHQHEHLKDKEMMTDRPTLSNRERIQLPHQEMPLCDSQSRIKNFDEVPMGYSDEQALEEAHRCLHCKKTRLCWRLPCRY